MILNSCDNYIEYVRTLKDIEAGCLEHFNVDPIYRGALLHYLYLDGERICKSLLSSLDQVEQYVAQINQAME